MTNEQLPAEVQNLTREVLDFVREIMDITKPLAPLGEEVIGIPLDWVRYYRYRNALVIRDRINEIHRERGITRKVPIPPRIGIPLLDAASMEDDPILQEMWAGLAANATDPNKRQETKKVFIDILSGLEPIDTVILRYLANSWDQASREEGQQIKIEEASAALSISHTEIQGSLHNLARLGCVRVETPEVLSALESSVPPTAPSIWSDEGEYHLTSLATDLLRACQS
jgi:hypothetical protein